jgi:hypothetical protein
MIVPPFIKKHHRLLFYSFWIVAGLIQASVTELQDDEAYYWVYSKFPSWGYFDHPPMTAMLIKAGYFFLHNELGVRLFPLLLNTLTLLIAEKLIDKQRPSLFYTICLSLGVLQLAGFFAVPDIPLLFFTALLFLMYKRYLEVPSWINALGIGLVTAFLLYSKYHGVLVLFFILISNLKLFSDIRIYVAGLFGLVLFLPHLLWQYHHGWITFKYHLVERNAHYDITYTTDYLIGQVLLSGPLAGFILLPSLFFYRVKNPLERALKYTAMGFYVFFLISSFKGRVEGNWTAPVMVSVIVLGHNHLKDHDKWRRWLYRLLPLSLLLTLIARIITVADLLHIDAITEKYFAYDHWPQELKKNTKGLPVVFNNNYQRASKYWFYTGQTCFSLNSVKERQNNYNIWSIEDSLLGKPVYEMDIYDTETFQHTLKTPLWTIGYSLDTNYHSFVKVSIDPGISEMTSINLDTMSVYCKATIPPNYTNYLNNHPQVNAPVGMAFFKDGSLIKNIYCGITLRDLLQDKIHTIAVIPQLPKGTYSFAFGIQADNGIYTRNSEAVKLIVK